MTERKHSKKLSHEISIFMKCGEYLLVMATVYIGRWTLLYWVTQLRNGIHSSLTSALFIGNIFHCYPKQQDALGCVWGYL
jgi:hypothetical protein